jgi:carboxyl-terminal processing protease
MRRRSGNIEFDHAPVPASTDHFGGPVVVLVDPDTASAAEMIAGALAAYDRGVVVGMRTYGKGCAQEYLDDEAGVGVLRLSTLVYALPDGKPVQKVGIRPHIEMDFGTKEEREDMIATAMAPWRGPDIRMASMVRSVPWPLHGGRVGPCRDEQVCKALRAVGLPGKSARAK